MNETFANLMPCVSESQAEIIRQVLLDAGIPAGVKGTSQESALAMGGAAISGVFVVVPQSRLSDAMKTLETIRKEEAGGPWHCGRCGAEVDAGFEICWSCQTPRSEAEQAKSE